MRNEMVDFPKFGHKFEIKLNSGLNTLWIHYKKNQRNT